MWDWPIDLMRWYWEGDGGPFVHVLTFLTSWAVCVTAGVVVGYRRAIAQQNITELMGCTAAAVGLGFVASVFMPFFVAVAWFGAIPAAIYVPTHLYARRKIAQPRVRPDPVLVAAQDEVERLCSTQKGE